MARGNTIVLSAYPQGKFDEGTITDTSKPGMFVEIVPATALINGRPSFRAVSRATGTKGPVAILREDVGQGKTVSDAYQANTRCFVYWPEGGEELNCLVGDVAGTASAEDVAIGDLFAIQSNGKIYHNSANASAPFAAMEAIHGWIQADYLLFCKYLGNQA